MSMRVRTSIVRCLVAMLVVLPALVVPALAVMPDEMLQDPVLESRARTLSQELRCVVCQNQSIDDSNAPLARDLRILLRERLTAGDSDEQAINYIVGRYGNFVLLKPPMQLNTYFLWFGPALFLVLAAIGFGRYVRNRSRAAPAGGARLTAAEQERLDALLKEGKSS